MSKDVAAILQELCLANFQGHLKAAQHYRNQPMKQKINERTYITSVRNKGPSKLTLHCSSRIYSQKLRGDPQPPNSDAIRIYLLFLRGLIILTDMGISFHFLMKFNTNTCHQSLENEQAGITANAAAEIGRAHV